MQQFVCALCFALAAAGGPSSPRDLGSGEREAVTTLVEKTLKSQDLWKGKIYLTSLEVILDEQPKVAVRYALATYYRYEGDVAFTATVRLDKMTVAAVQTHPHMPASLAPEELVQAEKLARAHPEVKKALAKYKHIDKIEVDATIAIIVQPDVPGYHHRVVRLFFRDAERNYLQYVPMIDVDLTTGEVRLDLIMKLHNQGQGEE